MSSSDAAVQSRTLSLVSWLVGDRTSLSPLLSSQCGSMYYTSLLFNMLSFLLFYWLGVWGRSTRIASPFFLLLVFFCGSLVRYEASECSYSWLQGFKKTEKGKKGKKTSVGVMLSV